MSDIIQRAMSAHEVELQMFADGFGWVGPTEGEEDRFAWLHAQGLDDAELRHVGGVGFAPMWAAALARLWGAYGLTSKLQSNLARVIERSFRRLRAEPELARALEVTAQVQDAGVLFDHRPVVAFLEAVARTPKAPADGR